MTDCYFQHCMLRQILSMHCKIPLYHRFCLQCVDRIYLGMYMKSTNDNIEGKFSCTTVAGPDSDNVTSTAFPRVSFS